MSELRENKVGCIISMTVHLLFFDVVGGLGSEWIWVGVGLLIPGCSQVHKGVMPGLQLWRRFCG